MNTEKINDVPGEVIYWESKVARSLGLSRERVRALREAHLSVTEWSTRGNAIVLTAAGLEKISFLAAQESAVVSTPSAEQVDAPAGSGGGALIEAGAPEVAVVRITRLFPNKRLMLAGERVVRVKDNSFFMPGMEIEAVNCGDGVWQYRGRLPRSRGRL